MMMPGRSGNSPCKRVLDELETLYLGGVKIEEEGVAVTLFRLDDGGGNGGGSFRVKHGLDAAEVTDVHEAGAGEVGDVAGEREMRIKSNTKIADRGIRGESSERGVLKGQEFS